MAISLGGGGSASQVNETIDINSAENLITLADGRVYLKGGVTDSDTATYPDASTNVAYSGVSFSLSAQTTNARGITWNGSHFFVVAQTANKVYKYTSAGVYTGTSYALSISNLPTGITWDGTYFWVVTTGDNKVYKYNASFVYQSIEFNIATRTTDPAGITHDGTHLWVMGTNANLSKWTTSGTDTGVNFSVSAQESGATSVAWDGTYLWVIGYVLDTAFQYTTAGVYTGTSISAASQETNPRGLTFAGSDLWVSGLTTNSAFKYAPQIGIVSRNLAGSGEGHNYTRIK